MTSKLDEHVEILKRLAAKSPMTHKHAACLIGGDKICTFGVNKRLRSTCGSGVALISIHAETDCLSNCHAKWSKGMDLLVIRVNNSNKLLNSRPCNSCIDKLRKRNIRKVYYSTNEGTVIYEYVSDMQKLHTCSGTKYRFNFN
jgi:deoxycytidylate deaminase